MRKRYALIIREAIYDVRHDWDLSNKHPRPDNVHIRSSKELVLYLEAYHRELDKLTRKERRQLIEDCNAG